MALPTAPLPPVPTSRRWNLTWFAAGLLVATAAMLGYLLLIAPNQGIKVNTIARPTLVPVMVQVEGAVARPGVFPLPAAARVSDAVQAAGGAAGNADTSRLNLAAHVNDGQRIVVPALGEPLAPADAPTPGARPTSATSRSKAPAGGGAAPQATASPSRPLNINSATAKELETLPGIGQTTAQKIVSYRQTTPFATVQQLLDAKLVNASTFARIQDLIAVE